MNDKIWQIELNGGTHDKETVTCEVCGVAQDGSLLCFNNENGTPTAIKGYAPGVWCKFSRSNLRMQ